MCKKQKLLLISLILITMSLSLDTCCWVAIVTHIGSLYWHPNFPSPFPFTVPKRNWEQRQQHHTITQKCSHARAHPEEKRGFTRFKAHSATIKRNLTGNKPTLTRDAGVSSDRSLTNPYGTFCPDPLITACVSICSYLHIVILFTLPHA